METPIPVRDTVSVGFEVESFRMVSVAVRVPTSVGEKVTVMLQLVFAASEVLQVLVSL